ncbi:MAG: carbamoyltransferase [Planctomycetes bacterium]|nr:carbamoyltransferase [Planctomycetota bacterium]
MKVLGIGCVFDHDPSAALLIDGKIVAAVDEERFSRKKHAPAELPLQSIKYCLAAAGIAAGDLDAVAFPWSYDAYRRHRWRFFTRNLRHRPDHALKAVFKSRDRKRRTEGRLFRALQACGIDRERVEVAFVEHHLAHASSSYHLSGFPSAAILTVDGKGEFTTTMFGEAMGPRIEILREFINPDSLGLFYSTLTDFLGFQVLDGEYKVMGMSGYGDAAKHDLGDLIALNGAGYRVNEKLVWMTGRRRYRGAHRYPAELVERWGPPRAGDALQEPYTHLAAATQRTLERAVLAFLDHDLAAVLARHDGRLAFAGGCALNVRLNRKIIEHSSVKELWVQPAANDSGTSLGAATYFAAARGERIEPQRHSYYGPEYTNDEIDAALRRYSLPAETPPSIIEAVADLLAAGKIVAWFQGRMEWGPRALGNRSILAHPAFPGIADQVNARIKFREKWRPFCPSIKKEHGPAILGHAHDSPYMTFSFTASEAWRKRIPEVVHVDGTCRPQLVSPELNPRFYELLTAFERRTNLPVLLNTSLNRRGEPVVCSPDDAIAMFYGSGLEFLALGNRLLRKGGGAPVLSPDS